MDHHEHQVHERFVREALYEEFWATLKLMVQSPRALLSASFLGAQRALERVLATRPRQRAERFSEAHRQALAEARDVTVRASMWEWDFRVRYPCDGGASAREKGERQARTIAWILREAEIVEPDATAEAEDAGGITAAEGAA